MLELSYLRSIISYDPATGHLTWLVKRNSRGQVVNPGKFAGSYGLRSRVEVRIDGKLYLAHRLAWFLVTGSWPESDIDHIDRDSSNNRWNNLRLATMTQNHGNRIYNKNNKLKVKGVCQTKFGTYSAQIQ